MNLSMLAFLAGPQQSQIFFQNSNTVPQRPILRFKKFMSLGQKTSQAALDSKFQQLRTIQTQEKHVELPRSAQRLQPPRSFDFSKMKRNRIEERMQNSTAMLFVACVGIEISFVSVTTKTGVNQVLVAFVSASGNRAIVIDSQFAARLRLAHAAVPAAAIVALSNLLMADVSHALLPNAEEFPCLQAKGLFKAPNFFL